MKLRVCFVALFLFFQIVAWAQFTFFPLGSTWKYKDDGSNQGTAWQSSSFDDSSWSIGAGQLGFGDGDETTVIASGHITYYFRKTVNIPDVNQYQNFIVDFYRDDGAVIYINGVEVIRDNMPTGAIAYNTFAFLAVDDGKSKISYTLPISQFQSGINTIAVEVHQESIGSSDVSWDMQLSAMPLLLDSFFGFNSTWKYLDTGTDQGTAWAGIGFDDSGWSSGIGKFGFPLSRVTTLMTSGAVTYYFRKKVNIPSVALYQNFDFQYYRDDGVVVYVNGVEVFRNNIADGTVNYMTTASSASDNGNSMLENSVPISAFVDGDNTIAVELHQSSAASSDVIFDMRLLGEKIGYLKLDIGPYLQRALPTSIRLNWRTNLPTDSKVWYGTSPSNLSFTASGTNPSTTIHAIDLTGLSPNTKYYYNIGTSSLMLDEDEGNYFLTPPVANTTGKYTFWAIGDSGDNSSNQTNARDKYNSYIGSNITNGWLLLGDNAYDHGLYDEYKSNFFGIYQSSIMRRTTVWPSPGNNDYDRDINRQKDHAIAYFDLFDPPVNAEAGGVASGSEAYYSFDYGNIHFISLDSYIIENNTYRLYDTGGPQFQWLQADLAANTKDWTIVYFHHPPYTMGSHNSDTEDELKAIRQNVIPLLEQYKVDLVLNGHSHNYERSRLMKGYFGLESDFNASLYNISQSSGVYTSASSCPYIKQSPGMNGTVYVVAGSAGELQTGQASWPHDAMYYSNNTIGGSFVLEIEENRLDGKWLASNGSVLDNFTIMKNVGNVSNITINSGESVDLKASWVGSYNWSSGATARTITVSPTAPITYTVTDQYGCITDTYNITVNPLPVKLVSFSAHVDDDRVLLNWKTATEVNNDFFEVQRFVALEEIMTLGKVPGNGTTTELHTYQFIDSSPLNGISFYRLKQVDFDGKCEYSKIVSADFSASNIIQVFPNPGSGIELGIYMGVDEIPVYISVQDVRGSEVISFSPQSDASSSMQMIKFDTPLSPGVYIIQIKSNSHITTRKWIVR